MNRTRRRGALDSIERLFRAGSAVGLSDGQLLERFAARHDEAAEAAFAALVVRHGPMVLSVCRRVLSSPNGFDNGSADPLAGWPGSIDRGDTTHELSRQQPLGGRLADGAFR